MTSDWHNAYASFIIELGNRLQAASDDRQRLELMAALKAELGGVPSLPQASPKPATHQVLHGEASGE